VELSSLSKETTRRARLETRTSRSRVRGVNQSATHTYRIIKGVVKLREYGLIFKQIFSTNSLRKCMEISVENLYVGIGAKKIKGVKGLKLWYYVSET